MIPTRATVYVTATRLVQGLGRRGAAGGGRGLRCAPSEQGVFFTILAMTQIQAAAEMGLTTVLVQVCRPYPRSGASRERAEPSSALDAAAARHGWAR